MKEPQQYHTINKFIGHKRTEDPNPSLAPRDHSDPTIETITPQNLSTTTVPCQLITPLDASDVRKVKKFNPLE